MENYADLYALDDEQDFNGGANEVYYADFDGGGQDTFCDFFGLCRPVLPNDREAGIGGGITFVPEPDGMGLLAMLGARRRACQTSVS